MDDDDHRVRHFAMLSQYAVFKDIIPSYRIRIPNAAEMATKVSKEVQRVRSQEAALLKAYQVHKMHESTMEFPFDVDFPFALKVSLSRS